MDKDNYIFPADTDANGWRDLALKDKKTGLASELAVDLWAQERYKPSERSYLAVFADVVDFGDFNNRYGQMAGDRLISEYGKGLQALCRQIQADVAGDDNCRSNIDQKDLFARVGGDEALLCYDLNGLSGEKLMDALDAITERYTDFLVHDTKTDENKRVRAVFLLITPSHPLSFQEVRENLAQQLVSLKNYEKKKQIIKRLVESELVEVQE